MDLRIKETRRVQNAVVTRDILTTVSRNPSSRRPSHQLHLRTHMSLRNVRFLIASLGNPPPYQSTRHSAGHILLRALASHLNFPPLTNRSKEFGNGYLSISEAHPEYTLWQSTSLMNASGPGVLKAWRAFSSTSSRDPNSPDSTAALILLHDELESSTGTLKVRRGPSTSARGHNGVKSVQGSLRPTDLMGGGGEECFVKIGVGIGRPASRDRDDVSAYVLGPMTGAEREQIQGSVGRLLDILQAEGRRISDQNHEMVSR